jgi:VCBS repeat-containing protein
VLDGDTDADGDALTAVLLTGPAHAASFTLNPDGSFEYVHDGSETTEDSFTYKAGDGTADSGAATVTITVKPVNDTPTDIALDNSRVPENEPSATVVGAFSTTDPDMDDSHTYTLVAGEGDADNALFSIDNFGSLRTAFSFDFETRSSYSVRVRSTDADGLSTEKAFAVRVTNVNEAPSLTLPDAATAYEDVDSALGGLKVGDVDGDKLTVNLAVGHGTLTVGKTDGLTVSGNGTRELTLSGKIDDLNEALASLVYRGDLNFSGSDTLHVMAGDGGLVTIDSVEIVVKSSAQQADDLQARVRSLREADTLSGLQALTLNALLELRGNLLDVLRVRGFLFAVDLFAQFDILTQAEADELLHWGNVLLLSLTRR